MSGPNVLVADDEPILRGLFTQILERAGCRVFQAADGDEAVRVFLGDPGGIDVAILDVGMPPEGGLATLRALLAGRPDLGVILTSGATLEREEQALLDGCRGAFVGKPFAPAELLRALEKVGPG